MAGKMYRGQAYNSTPIFQPKTRKNQDSIFSPMTITELPIKIDREKIAEFCRARGIRKLSLFGSVLRDDFDPVRSDVDVLAEFEPDSQPGLKFFGYGDELAEIIHHKVDFNTEAWLSKYFRGDVVREAMPIYDPA